MPLGIQAPFPRESIFTAKRDDVLFYEIMFASCSTPPPLFLISPANKDRKKGKGKSRVGSRAGEQTKFLASPKDLG